MPGLIHLLRTALRERFAPRTQQSAEVKDSLVKALYASPASLLSGAISGGSLGLVVAYYAQLPPITVISVLICVVGVSRSISAVYFQRQLAHQDRPASPIWGASYELGAWAYAALLGLHALATLTMTDAATLHVLSVGMVASYAGGISGRNAGRVHVAVGQTCFSLLPTSLGLILAGGLGYTVLGILCFLMIFAMAEITKTTHRVVLQALLAKNEKAMLAQKFERLARYDSLTGVENRMAMQMRLQDLFEQRESDQDAMAILWMDLDRFKEINDTLGHMVGDQLLCQVAERLIHSVSGRAHVARFGGDEFIIICAHGDRVVADAVACDIMREFAHPFDVSGYSLSVTASMGIAVAPADGREADELLRHADLALYQAKHGGRNRHSRFDWSMKERQNRVYELEMGLRAALANGDLRLHYQPIFNSTTGRIVICEALMRWDHPRLGPISPGEFIPIAESSSLIEPITTWALEKACMDAMTWDDDIRVAVNISPALIKSDGLSRSVMAALLKAGMRARRLELEVTESTFLEDDGHTHLILAELRRIGLRLALDDFGTGYSSLGSLRSHAFDTIKVDQSFMRGVGENPRDRAIAQSVAYLAHSLDVETVAEGIESEEQLRYAREVGFTNVQGFVLARPMPIDALLTLMAQMQDDGSNIAGLMEQRRLA
ncbi:EAL domain-containing protein [Sphingobium sp. CR2-8]|uniref:putative bifunctional diguanylate cyclase/phosphodiesterase n=1 Tax=Sphingobium sp. CR2-8 TaxID=1306534 RepID=UPI002DB7A5EF|nr:EAL domain-containing protein [Sphingobium sp. CR2-8]MEC3911720.1 EAL domain-containing protein [Sphingobium sp. CR2-8]